jgi:hypothetical protein
MDTLNDDHQDSSMQKIIAPELHRSKEVNSRIGASKADSRYWMQGKRLVLGIPPTTLSNSINKASVAGFPWALRTRSPLPPKPLKFIPSYRHTVGVRHLNDSSRSPLGTRRTSSPLEN